MIACTRIHAWKVLNALVHCLGEEVGTTLIPTLLAFYGIITVLIIPVIVYGKLDLLSVL